MKTYSLPERIAYNYNHLDYGTEEGKFKKHIFSLEKQVFCNDLFVFLFNEKDIESFVLNIDKKVENTHNKENIYRPEIRISFDFSIENIVFSDKNKDLNIDIKKGAIEVVEFAKSCEKALSSFINYISDKGQENVLWWIYKLCKDNKLNPIIKKDYSGFKFNINKEVLEILIKDAYGIDFSYFYNDYLNDRLLKNKLLTDAKRPIIKL